MHPSSASTKKGNRQLCDNYRGISLLAIAGKILARVLRNRLIVHMEHGLLPDSQCGFRSGRGTVDMIFAARQLQEKFQEQYDDLFITLIDLTKAIDTVCRDGLCQIMEKFGCQRNSQHWFVNYMTALGPEFLTTVILRIHLSSLPMTALQQQY